jgi:hypothetical protein
MYLLVSLLRNCYYLKHLLNNLLLLPIRIHSFISIIVMELFARLIIMFYLWLIGNLFISFSVLERLRYLILY